MKAWPLLLILSGAAAAADAPDTSKWECKFCPLPSGSSGLLDLGAGYVSDDSFRYGEYTGLRKQGTVPLAGGEWRYDGDSTFLHLDASDFGLDSRVLDARASYGPAYRAKLTYREIPQYRFDEALTPFRNAGGEVLPLPAGWAAAGSTGTMASLPASLRDLDVLGHRIRSGIALAFTSEPGWDYSLAYRHEQKSGIGTVGGSFITFDSILPYPLASDTDELDLTAGGALRCWQLLVGYSGSRFTNHHDALTWQNPYTPASPGADTGRLALAPDNQSHQFSFSASYQPHFLPLRATAQLALGRVTQDEPFLPATTNPNLAAPLPRASLDGAVDSLAATVRASADPLRRVRISAEYRYRNRDNRTPVDTFPQVITDTATSAPRDNLPYSFIQNALSLRGDYRAASWLRLSAGAGRDERRRDLQARSRTTEDAAWARLDLQPLERLGLQLRAKRSWRDGSALETVTNVTAPENPLEQAFHLANRRRDEAGMDLSLLAHERATLGAGLTYAKDRYASGGALGLRDRRDLAVNANASIEPLEQLRVTGFVLQDWYHAGQDGSQSSGAADWSGRETDRLTSYGLRAERPALFGVDVGAEYVFTRADATIDVVNNGSGGTFPDLFSRLHEARLYALYRVRPQLALRLDLRRDSFAVRDWALDDVAPDTIPNVLALGQGSRPYRATFAGLSARYSFGGAAGGKD